MRAEVEDVVRRLRHHPSIALWCGNNESESNMGGGQNWVKKYATATWAEYDRIFHETIPQTVLRHDPDRPYWPSSPHHPLDRAKEKPDWETSSGNAHSYDVWGDGLPFSTFDGMGQYRFMAEFGYQALPDLETIRGMTAPEDRYYPSHVLEHHENSGNGKTNDLGTARIARHLAATFGMPSGLDDWVYLSQALQADGIRRGVEALRRNHPQSTGALYWQLDDNWPVDLLEQHRLPRPLEGPPLPGPPLLQPGAGERRRRGLAGPRRPGPARQGPDLGRRATSSRTRRPGSSGRWGDSTGRR